MTETADLVIRGGTIVDGSGGEPFEADVVIAGGRITAVERHTTRRGAEEIDARGPHRHARLRRPAYPL